MRLKRKILAALAALVVVCVPLKSFALSSADLNSWQTNSNNLAGSIDQASTVKDHGFIYEIGGLINTNLSYNVTYAAVNSNGSVGSWQSTTSLPTRMVGTSAVQYGGYIYVLGGYNDNSTYYNTVYYAQINNDGSLGSWQTTTSLPAVDGYATAVVSNGYIYELGGYGTNGAVNTVYSAQINSNGTLGSWQTLNNLPTSDYNSSAVTFNGYIYEIGGNGPSSELGTVEYAPVQTGGTIGSWQSTTNLPVTTHDATAVVSDGYIYELGGFQNTAYSTAVYYAPINSNGTVGSWQTSANPLPGNDIEATSIVLGGYIYELGGYYNGNGLNSVYYSQLNFNNTKLITNTVTSGLVYLNTAIGTNLTCSNSVSESSLAKQDIGYTYPIGLVNLCYTTDNTSDVVRLTFVTNLTPSEVVARDYNTTTNTYVNVPGATINESAYNGQPALIVNYTVTQGGVLDSSQTNGQVVDPLGLAVATSTSSSSVTTPDTGYGQPDSDNLTTILAASLITTIAVGFVLNKRFTSKN
jgi:N-acetylneuraminic acid mutarotase